MGPIWELIVSDMGIDWSRYRNCLSELLSKFVRDLLQLFRPGFISDEFIYDIYFRKLDNKNNGEQNL